MRIPVRNIIISMVAVAALGAAAAYGADIGMLPPESVQAGVTYVTGGIGADEAAAMRQAASRYSLAIELAAKATPRDAYVADVKVDIRDGQGRSVLGTTTDGPFLLAKLPAGRYTISAEIEGRSQQKTVALADGAHQRVLFEFAVAVD